MGLPVVEVRGMRVSARTYLRDRGDGIAQALTFQADWGAGQIWRTQDPETLVSPMLPTQPQLGVQEWEA